MSEPRTPFEMRLGLTFEQYANAAPIEVDAPALATYVARRDARLIEVFGHTFVKPRWLVPVLIALMLVLALAAAAFVGAELMRPRLLEDQLQVAPIRDYAGVLRPIGPGKLSPTAVLPLSDGRVFASRPSESDAPDSYEMVDVDTGEIRQVGRGLTRRWYPGLIELQDGRVLIVAADYAPYADGASGPSTTVTAEIFDPKTGLTAFAGNLVASRFWPTVIPLQDGRVLIAGGAVPPDGLEPIDSAEVYDPRTGTFTATGSMSEPRYRAAAVGLPDGTVLFIGTATNMLGTQTAEIFDPATGTFGEIEGPRDPRFGDAARLGGGRVLVVHGGCGEVHTMLSDGFSDTARPVAAEIYDPFLPGFLPAPDMPHCVSNLVGLPDGRAFVSGFYYENGGNPEMGDLLRTWSGVYDHNDGTVLTMQGPRGYLPQAVGLADGRVLIWPGGYGWDGGVPAWGDILE